MYFNKGLSVSEIAKRTSHSRNTISKYIYQEDFNLPQTRAKQSCKSDLVRPFVRQILMNDKDKRRKQRHTAKRIYERALEEIPDLCLISERTMRKVVAKEREDIYTEKRCYLDLDHPGGEAQVDFGEIDVIENGKVITAHEFVMTFPASNNGLCQITMSETFEAVCDSLEKMFEHIGKVPNRIWFDQMAAAALRKKDDRGNAVVNPRFQRFALHHGFEVVLCNPNSGNEKGSVENKVGYFRNNLFIPEPEFHDLETYNRELLKICDKDNKREHYKYKPTTIDTLFKIELEQMHGLNPVPFDYSKEIKYRVDKQGYIKEGGNQYSVSPSKVGEHVIVKYYANELVIYDLNYREITRHRRSFEKGKKFTHWIDFITVVAKHPRALKYTKFYSLLPDVWQDYTSHLDKQELRDALLFLKHCLIKKDFDFAVKVVQENVKQHIYAPEALMTTYRRLTENTALYLPKTENNLPQMPSYTVHLEDYDSLMGGMQ